MGARCVEEKEKQENEFTRSTCNRHVKRQADAKRRADRSGVFRDCSLYRADR